jgi:hypothetical protein
MRALFALLLAIAPSAAHASSDAAWAAFRTETSRACLAAAQRVLGARGRLTAVVSPQGTEAHGLARVTHVVGKKSTAYVCVMDKRTKVGSLDPAPIADWRTAG